MLFVVFLVLKFWDSILQGRMGEGEPDIGYHSGDSVQCAHLVAFQLLVWIKRKGLQDAYLKWPLDRKLPLSWRLLCHFHSEMPIKTNPANYKGMLLNQDSGCGRLEGALSRVQLERANREGHKPRRVNILRHWVGTSQTGRPQCQMQISGEEGAILFLVQPLK